MRTFLKQVVDSYYHTGYNEQRGRTAQFVPVETKASQVDELADFGRDRPCSAYEEVFKASGRLILPHQVK